MKYGLQFFNDTYLTVIGLSVFFGYFILLLFKVFRFNKDQINYFSNIPFEQEVSNEQQ